jgi:hypothetical protein
MGDVGVEPVEEVKGQMIAEPIQGGISMDRDDDAQQRIELQAARARLKVLQAKQAELQREEAHAKMGKLKAR